jgi:uncharacterized repeat protein (TIGR01451 family)
MWHRGVFISLAALLVCLACLGVGVVLGQSTDTPASTPVVPPPPPLKTGAPAEQPKPKAEDGPALKTVYETPTRQSVPVIPPPPGTTAGPAAPSDKFNLNEVPPEGGPGQSNDNPTGRQEPCVSLEWIGPPTAKVGQAVTYQLIVKNLSAAPVMQVVVRNRVPNGVSVQATEPKAFNEGNVWAWDLGTLQPRQEKRLDMQMLPEAKGDIACHASVTFTGTTIARLRVREPKLAIKATAVDKVLLGDTTTITLTVSNPGDGTADRVKVRASLTDGLEHIRGRALEYDIGNLGPNESRSIQLVCNTKAGGEQKCNAIATAEGNLMAQDSAVIEVILPQLKLLMSGPRLRYLDRHATYVLKVTNPGSAPANNVTISTGVPAGFKFTTASDGGRHDFSTRSVSWYLGDVAPNATREVNMEVVAVNTGVHKFLANAMAARGIKTETEYVTRVEGLSALLMELVDLDDPVEIGADTAYEIRVTNTGSKTETNLQLVCTIPEKMEYRGAECPTGCKARLQGRELTFDSLPKLAPRADVLYRVKVRGLAAGDLRFRARITADGLTDPVLKEESTKVYGDEAPPTPPK